MSGDGFRIEGDVLAATTREAIGGIADRAAAAGHPDAEFYRAAAAGRIGLMRLEQPTAKWPAASLGRWTRPAIVCVGDDGWPVRESLGPLRWKAAERLRRWCSFAVIHGSGPAPGHYRMALTLAALHGRLAFIECDSAHLDEWGVYFGNSRTILIRPPEGQHHPSPPDRRGMH